MNETTRELLRSIYSTEDADRCMDGLSELMSRYSGRLVAPGLSGQHRGDVPAVDGAAGDVPTDDGSVPGRLPFDESDSLLITYGDQFYGSEDVPLRYLLRFLNEELDGHVTGVHILPFSPFSSDDGFSVIDYRKINPELGDWDDIRAISRRFRLMADLVLNHCSSRSAWFEALLNNEEPYRRYFIVVEPGTDTGTVIRPQALPLLTPYDTRNGEKLVWTTFSADQVDLNYHEPDVLLEMLDILLSYVENGAQLIRLDSIGYLWKELGTTCLHHLNTHRIVQLFRAVLQQLAPWVAIVTDTNAPHEANVGYFGDGTNEAHIVYNYPLPPLTLYACIRQDTTHLQTWARGLPALPTGVSFLNFLASHDGIGLSPTHGILSDAERDIMIQTVLDRGGRISYRSSSLGDIPYEMNVSFLSAVADPNLPDDQRARIFLASQSIMLSLAGVPGIYIHSLIGSTNWADGVEKTGMNRSINRRKLEYDAMVAAVGSPGSLRSMVFEGYKQLLRARAKDSAFHPSAAQEVLETDRELFVVLRTDEAAASTVICLHNLSNHAVDARIPSRFLKAIDNRSFVDLITLDLFFPHWESQGGIEVGLEPHEVMWLKLR